MERGRDLPRGAAFYETLLPALQSHRRPNEHWLQFEAAGADSANEFFDVRSHRA